MGWQWADRLEPGCYRLADVCLCCVHVYIGVCVVIHLIWSLPVRLVFTLYQQGGMQEACALRQGPPVFVACPRMECGGTNCARFNFCQWRGVPRRMVALAVDAVTVDEALISNRVGAK